MRMIFPSIATICLVTISSVGYSSQPNEMNLAKASEFVEFADKFFKSNSEKPKNHNVEKIKNVHVEGQIDEWHTLQFDGFNLNFYRVVPEKRDILSSLTIETPKIQMPFGIKIGITKQFILKELGKPTTIKQNEFIYQCGDDTFSQNITFKFKDDFLILVLWEYEID